MSLWMKIGDFFMNWDGEDKSKTLELTVDELRLVASINQELHALRFDKEVVHRWIPCSERFPEVTQQYGYDHGSEPVQVTFKSIFDGTPHTAEQSAVYTGEKWKWFDSTDDLSNMEDVICEITAWKPLPEPYNDLGE